MGELSDAQKAKAFEGMAVLIVPSIWLENFSLVTQEAFLFGVPVIASNYWGVEGIGGRRQEWTPVQSGRCGRPQSQGGVSNVPA